MINPNGIIVQSGGPTAVINQTLFGIALFWPKGKNLFGSLYGVLGLINDNLISFGDDSVKKYLPQIAQTPSAGIGTSRFSLENKIEVLEKIFKTFKVRRIGYVFIIGGEDSRRNARILAEYARNEKIEIIVVHIPKTIDNDLTVTHHSPGYGSAARFVTQAVAGIELESKAMPGRVMIDIIMGRSAGWLTAASVLARGRNFQGPHLIYLPEAEFNEEKLLRDVENTMSRQGRVHIAASEGVAEQKSVKNYIKKIGLEKIARALSDKDDFNHINLSGTGLLGFALIHLIKTRLKIKGTRVNSFEYLQRSFPVFSKVDRKEAFKAGEEAVQMALSTIKPGGYGITLGDEKIFEYNENSWFFNLEEAFSSGGKILKTFPPELIIGGNDISEKFREYIGPLADPLPNFKVLSQLG